MVNGCRIKMKRLIFILLVILFFLPDSNAQLWKYKRFQASGYLGTSQFFGDVGGFTRGENAIGFKDMTLKQTRFTVGASVKFWVVEDATIRGGVSFTMVHGTDVRGSNINRGFVSTASIIEPTIGGEYYFIRNKARNSYLFLQSGRLSSTSLLKLIDVYATVNFGAAIFSVTPNELLESRMGKDSGVAFSVPVGVGADLVLSPKVCIGTEMLIHGTFTDYLDGYTSQYSARNDMFYTWVLSFNYNFKLKKSRYPSGVRR